MAVKRRPDIEFSDDDVASFLEASFAFRHEEGKAGQSCPAQLTIHSSAFASAPPVTLEKIQVQFDGSLRTIHLKHMSNVGETPRSSKPHVSHVSLAEIEASSDEESDGSSESESQTDPTIILEGTGDLTLSPGQTRVFEMDVPLREPGEAKAFSIQVSLATESFTLKYDMKIRETNAPGFWYSHINSKRTTRIDPQIIKVLPRPPKMELRLVNESEQYYTNESIQLEVEILNQEEADANTKLDVHVYGQNIPSFKVRAADGVERSSPPGDEESRLHGLPVGTIKTSGSAKAIVTFDPIERPSGYNIAVRVSYSLVSDPATPIIQLFNYELNVVTPFEASYDLLPRLHSEWPSLFNYNTVQNLSDGDDSPTRPSGLAQKWSLVTRYCSFASEDLSITDLDVKVLATHGGVTCTTSKTQSLPSEGQKISPKTIEEAQFDLIAQKASLDDRSPAAAEFAFEIHWRRPGSPSSSENPPNVTTLPIPRFFVTVSEPRVLASVSYGTAPTPSIPTNTSTPKAATTKPQQQQQQPLLLFLTITIENPSSHFLTFGMTMEPSTAAAPSSNASGSSGGEEFAFSGPKTTTLNVLPMSRRSVSYRLLPLVRGTWVRPRLVVRDKYFQKVLRVVPTEGLKGDKDGILVWIPPPADEDDDDGEEEEGETGEDDDDDEDEDDEESGNEDE